MRKLLVAALLLSGCQAINKTVSVHVKKSFESYSTSGTATNGIDNGKIKEIKDGEVYEQIQKQLEDEFNKANALEPDFTKFKPKLDPVVANELDFKSKIDEMRQKYGAEIEFTGVRASLDSSSYKPEVDRDGLGPNGTILVDEYGIIFYFPNDDPLTIMLHCGEDVPFNVTDVEGIQNSAKNCVNNLFVDSMVQSYMLHALNGGADRVVFYGAGSSSNADFHITWDFDIRLSVDFSVTPVASPL